MSLFCPELACSVYEEGVDIWYSRSKLKGQCSLTLCTVGYNVLHWENCWYKSKHTNQNPDEFLFIRSSLVLSFWTTPLVFGMYILGMVLPRAFTGPCTIIYLLFSLDSSSNTLEACLALTSWKKVVLFKVKYL